MFRFLNNIQIDILSYIFGFITGMLAVGLLALLKLAVPRLRKLIAERITTARAELTSGAEVHFRNAILRNAQKSHITSQMFNLDEILIKPYLQAPPPLMLPGSHLLDDLENTLTIPYLPDWPELSAVFHGRTLTIPEALSRGVNIAIIGNPGAGKSTALAYMASMLARRSAEAETLKDLLPVFIHAQELASSLFSPVRATNKPTIDSLIEAVSRKSTLLMQPRVPALIRNAFESGQVLLLLDGLDELPPDQIQKINTFVESLLSQYPKARLILAASPDYYNGALALGILPIAIAAWDERQRSDFINQWSEKWEKYIAPGIQEGTAIDPLILKGWLSTCDYFATPLELTLKIWSAFSGDTLGPDLPANIDSYLRRLTVGIPWAREAMEMIAGEMVKTCSSSVLLKDAENWLSRLKQLLSSDTTAIGIPATGTQDGNPGGWQRVSVDSSDLEKDAGNESEATAAQEETPLPVVTKSSSRVPKMSPAQEMLAKLTDTGVLIKNQDRYFFVHPIILGYLASSALAKEPEKTNLETQPNWTGLQVTLPFLAPTIDVSPLLKPALDDVDDPLYRKLLSAARWLRLAPSRARWRGPLLRQLVNLLQSEIIPFTLRAKVITALVSSGDPGIAPLLKQMFSHRQENVRILAVLGCGLGRDNKSTTEIIQLTGDLSMKVAQAAVLSLAAIGSRQALDAIGQILLQGTEELRKVAAEALAFLPEEGHPALKEGSTMDDLLVRRAVVYGLVRINESWALETLKQMQIEDGQWVVRSAATQALEDMQKRDNYYPQILPPPQESPWLLAYAAKQGLGVLPGKPAINLIIQALKSDDIYEILAALAYLERTPDAGGIPNIYQVMYGSGGDLKEAAFYSIWQLAGAGVELPSPTQFGLG